MLRLNVAGRKQALKVVKELDAFPKIPESYQETSPARGSISIITFGLILVLVVSEIVYYSSSHLRYQYEVDKIFDGKLKINIDITVAMKCEHMGADVLDLTGQNAETFGELQEESVVFELTERQKRYQDMIHHVNKYIRNEYHAIHEFLWKSGFQQYKNRMPERDEPPPYAPDACRVHGSLEVNKVAGNFHITAGKSIPVLPRGHAHLALMVQDREYNFSHRIDHFSFGDQTTGLISPLEGDEKITENNYHIYQYFLQVVPTAVNTRRATMETYQYAVTEHDRKIDHSKGSHGVPGIFIKYDLASFKVTVREEHKPYSQFLVRLCGIIGGIFATSGMLHGLVGFFFDVVCCRYKIGKYSPKDQNTGKETIPARTSSLNESLNSEVIPGINLLAQDNSNFSHTQQTLQSAQ